MNFLNNGELKMTKSKSFNEYILNDLKTDEDGNFYNEKLSGSKNARL